MIKSFCAGRKFTILFLIEEGRCPVEEWLRELQLGGRPQRQDFETMITRRLAYTAENGLPFNPEHCKELEDGIFEFKAGNGARLLWFYDPVRRAVVVCTNGFQKPASNRGYRQEIKRAQDLRDRYRAWVEEFQNRWVSGPNAGKPGE